MTDPPLEEHPGAVGAAHAGQVRLAHALARSGVALDTPQIQRLQHELGVYQMELEMQNEQLRQTQLALEASRDRYRNLYEQAPVAYLTLDLQGRIARCNRAAEMLLAASATPLQGRHFAECVQPQHQSALRRALQRLLRGDGEQQLVLRLGDAAGARWTQARILLARDEADTPQARIALVDIDEQVRAQERAAHLAAIVECSDAAMIGRAPDGTVTSWNAAAMRLFGYGEAEMLGRTMAALVPEDLAQEEVAQLAGLREGRSYPSVESERLTRSGTRVPVSLSLSPVWDARRHVVGSAMVARDITAQRLAERAQAQRMRQLDLLSHTGQQLILGRAQLADMSQALFEEVAQALHSEIQLNYGLGDAPRTLKLLSSLGLSESQRTLMAMPRWGESLCGLVAQSGCRLVLSELPRRAIPQAERLQAAGAKCYAGFPLMLQGRVHGVAAFASTSQAAFGEAELQVMQAVSDQIGAMLERDHLLQELHQREDALRRADQAKDEFIAILAHELRNPLAPILSAVGILRSVAPGDAERLVS